MSPLDAPILWEVTRAALAIQATVEMVSPARTLTNASVSMEAVMRSPTAPTLWDPELVEDALQATLEMELLAVLISTSVWFPMVAVELVSAPTRSDLALVELALLALSHKVSTVLISTSAIQLTLASHLFLASTMLVLTRAHLALLVTVVQVIVTSVVVWIKTNALLAHTPAIPSPTAPTLFLVTTAATALPATLAMVSTKAAWTKMNACWPLTTATIVRIASTLWAPSHAVHVPLVSTELVLVPPVVLITMSAPSASTIALPKAIAATL